eukprot:1157256-Pelagomonas_calceolata.AAC.12
MEESRHTQTFPLPGAHSHRTVRCGAGARRTAVWGALAVGGLAQGHACSPRSRPTAAGSGGAAWTDAQAAGGTLGCKPEEEGRKRKLGVWAHEAQGTSKEGEKRVVSDPLRPAFCCNCDVLHDCDAQAADNLMWGKDSCSGWGWSSGHEHTNSRSKRRWGKDSATHMLVIGKVAKRTDSVQAGGIQTRQPIEVEGGGTADDVRHAWHTACIWVGHMRRATQPAYGWGMAWHGLQRVLVGHMDWATQPAYGYGMAWHGLHSLHVGRAYAQGHTACIWVRHGMAYYAMLYVG